MNKTMGKRKAIFLGNGFTRALVKNVPTWGQLIGCFNQMQFNRLFRIHFNMK